MCSYDNIQTGVKFGLKHNKYTMLPNWIGTIIIYQNKFVQYMNIKKTYVGFKKNIKKHGLIFTII